MGNQSERIFEKFTPSQLEAAQTIDRDVLVRAGAGSGKTKTLAARFLHLLDEHRDWHPADITAVTFTRKAAREMQSRIRKNMMDIVLLSETEGEKQFWVVFFLFFTHQPRSFAYTPSSHVRKLWNGASTILWNLPL